MTKDMTVGSPVKLILTFSVPLLIGNIFQQFSGNIAIIFYNMLSSVLRALGDSKTPLYYLIVASILNVILDIVFIVNFNMGVSGAAYATIISQSISAILCGIHIVKKFPILKLKKKHWKIRKSYAEKQLRIGIPMALQFSITAAGAMVLQGALNNFGSKIIASYTAASKVQQLVMQPAVTFGVAMATYSGQNLGAGRIDRIKEGVKKSAIISIIVSIISTIVVVLFGGTFTKMFMNGNDIEVLSYAKHYLNTVSVFYIPLGLIFIYRNTLQGLGESFVPMMAGFAEMVARTVVAFTLPLLLDFTGIALADPAAWIAACVPLMITYYKRINIIMKEKQITLNQQHKL